MRRRSFAEVVWVRRGEEAEWLGGVSELGLCGWAEAWSARAGFGEGAAEASAQAEAEASAQAASGGGLGAFWRR